MHARRWWRAAIAVVLVASGCGDDGGSVPEADAATTTALSTTAAPTPATDAPPSSSPEASSSDGALVDLAWLDDSTHTYVLVDTRPADLFAAGSIPGARSLPAAAFNDAADDVPYQLASGEDGARAMGAAGLGPDDVVVLYDDEGSLNAARVYFAMTYFGHEELRILDGGLGAWTGDGREVAVGAPAEYEAFDFPVRDVRAELRLELPDVSQALTGGLTTFADARSPAEYDGSTESATAQQGHIPGAGNVDYAATIDADGRFLPLDELQALYTAAGVDPDEPVVTYCLVGARAAHAWFVLSELLGYPSVAVYDGSWIEYGNAPGVDVEP